MPRLLQPLTMRKCALQSVAEHLEIICYGCVGRGAEMRRMIQDDSYLTVQGPLTHWSCDLLEELMESVAQTRALGRMILHQLIQPNLSSLNLACGVGDVYYAIQFTTDRCKNLQRLDLSFISYLGPNLLVQLVTKLTHVKSINFQMTPVTDQVLIQIGISCRELRHLDVSSAPITDLGLRGLSRAEDGTPQLPFLNRIALLDTQVSTYGVANILRALPQIRIVDYENLFQVFDHLSELDSGRESADTDNLLGAVAHYQLTEIKSSVEVNSNYNLQTAACLCPRLRSIALTIGLRFQVNETFWKSVTRLDCLTELSLTNGPSALNLDFYLHVVPVLQTIGHQIHNLILTRFAAVDIITIGTSCLGLKNLALSEICYFAPVESLDSSLFNRLEALELWSVVGVALPTLLIKQLLNGCQNIRNLLFRYCESVTDSLLTELWTVNPMTALSHVTFDGCCNVSLTILLSLLIRENDLNMLRLWNNPQLDHEDYAQLLATVKSANMDLAVDWYPYTDFT